MVVAGALAGVGSFLTWANVTVADVSASATGTDGSDGYITLVAGILLFVVGIVSLRAGRRALAILAIVAGLVAGGVGIYDAATAQDSVLDAVAEQLAPQVGASVDAVRAVLQRSADAGDLDISLQLGLYLVIAGGALGLLGGVTALVRSSAERSTAIPMPGPAGPATTVPDLSAGPTPSGASGAPPPAPPPPPPTDRPPTDGPLGP
jgi:hypothetical protein